MKHIQTKKIQGIYGKERKKNTTLMLILIKLIISFWRCQM